MEDLYDEYDDASSDEEASNEDENKIEIKQISSFTVYSDTQYYLVNECELFFAHYELSFLYESVDYGNLCVCDMNGFTLLFWKMDRFSVYNMRAKECIVDDIKADNGLLMLVSKDFIDMYDVVPFLIKCVLPKESIISMDNNNVTFGQFMVTNQIEE